MEATAFYSKKSASTWSSKRKNSGKENKQSPQTKNKTGTTRLVKKKSNSGKENKQSPQTKNKTGTTRLVKKKSAVLIERRCPAAVTVSKEQMSEFTRRLLNLEARIGLLEAHFSEKTHPPTADQSTSTDPPVDPSTSVDTQMDCQQSFEMWSSPRSAHEDHSLSAHLGNADFGVPSSASTPLTVRTLNLQTSPDHSLAGSASVGLTNNPEVTNSMHHSETSPNQDYSAFSHPSVMASFHLSLPETPRNTSRSHHHHHIRRSLMQGVILPDVLLNHVSLETENKLYLDSTGPDGKPRADRFAVLLFKRLIPLNLYQNWAGSVNFDGSRGKNALPNNLRQALSDAVGRRFNPAVRDWKLIRDRLNELLRNRRTTFPLF
ncbi:uncharacterized protein [Paramormyrops kingsleyae]|uniref:uncharacterized protein n=1 Tax=Paramormyrops kingsleyae TaxID=1676925 RepID=UPI003B979597